VLRKEIKLDPTVMSKLVELAGIIESPFPRVENIHGYKLTRTSRQWFESQITANISTAHTVAALNNAGQIKTGKKIGRLARELECAVRASDQSHLSYFLPRGSTIDSCIAAVNDLAKAAQEIGRLKKAKRKGKMAETMRKVFIEQVLDAAHEAGGEFRLNRRNGGGSLIEAIDLLAPYLPPEFLAKTSDATLRAVRNSWLKNKENKKNHTDFSLPPRPPNRSKELGRTLSRTDECSSAQRHYGIRFTVKPA